MDTPLIRYGKYLLIAAILYFPLFSHLGSLSVRIWDEARLAQSAYEMLQNGNFLIQHINGKPDMWSTKPPLLIWAIIINMKLFGINELAVRLPSAMAALGTMGALFFFLKKISRTEWLGIFSVLILVSTAGYITEHASRTGDYDAPMTLFTTISCLAYYTYLEKKDKKYLHIFFVALTIAALIKSVNALLFIPALLIYTIIDKKLVYIFKQKHFYIGIGYTIFFILGYYLTREYYNPGYLKAVYNNELGGRFLEALESHGEPFFYYLSNLESFQYSFWIWLVPVGVYLGFKNESKQYKRFTLFTTLLILVYFLVISISQTKLAWYITPVFPFLAIIVSNVIYYIFEKVKARQSTKELNWILPIIVGVLFTLSYVQVFNKNYCPSETKIDASTYYTSYYLKKAIKENKSLSGYTVLYDGYKEHVRFYVSILNSKGSDIHFIDETDVRTGDKVIIQDQNTITRLKVSKKTKLLDHYDGIEVLEFL